MKNLGGKPDLHVHSVWSDGSLPIPRIIKTAKALELTAVSITDHDTTAGWEEVREEDPAGMGRALSAHIREHPKERRARELSLGLQPPASGR
ncbi:MAG: PHP domain-containing protein [Treponema sp.]|nr:PHP domain-containing protein [Treponema sp.]